MIICRSGWRLETLGDPITCTVHPLPQGHHSRVVGTADPLPLPQINASRASPKVAIQMVSLGIIVPTYYAHSTLNWNSAKMADCCFFHKINYSEPTLLQLCTRGVEIYSNNVFLSYLEVSEYFLVKIKLSERNCQLKGLP